LEDNKKMLDIKEEDNVECKCVSKHVPLPTKFYYISITDRVIKVCPTTFFNMEELLAQYQVYETLPPGRVRKHYSKFVQDLCLELWRDNLRNDEKMTNR
jgi:hypothetical protein